MALAAMGRVILKLCIATCIISVAHSTESVPSVGGKAQLAYPDGDRRNCQLAKGTHGFEALPGGGWDNLRNLEMGQVMLPTYSVCRTTEDGKYLIPDSTFALPVKSTDVESFAEIINDWKEYKDMTSRSINADVSFFSMISGSYSDSREEVKKHQMNDKSATTRVQIRRHLYTIKAQPDAPLNPACKNRLLEVGAHVQSNNTALAEYTAQLFVRDFGTHYVTSVDVGAILAQEDSVKDTFVADYSLRKSEVRAAASASFFGKISAGAGYSSAASQESKTGYIHNLTSSHLKTFGGPGFKGNFTLKDWEEGLENNLVPIDRSGDPIYYVITHATLPEVPDPIRREIASHVEKAVQFYYKVNTYKGCTKRDSPNFSFAANIDDGSCSSPLTNFTFGGVYQTCSLVAGSDSSICKKLDQRNPLTGDHSCPDQYTAVPLASGSQSTTRKEYECQKRCHSCGFLWLSTCCNQDCRNNYYTSRASYKGYWCSATGPVHQGSGFMFGGVYTSTHANLLTQSFSCPPHFLPLQLGGDMKVCVGDDVELGGVYQIPFAGFFSCKSGNPLALFMPKSQANRNKRSLYSFLASAEGSEWPHRCPSGYMQHFADLDDSCEINFCAKANALSGASTVSVIRPPFERTPARNPNSTNLLFIMGPTGKGWIRNETTSEWKLQTMEEMIKIDPAHAVVDDDDNTKNQTTGGIGVSAAVGIAVGATAFVALVILVVFILVRQRASKSSKFASGQSGYGSLGDQYSEAGV